MLYEPPENVYGVLAAPPCTEFSRAKHFHGKGNYHHDFRGGLAIVDACLRIIMVTKPKFWALENPNGYLITWLGKPSFSFEPYYYGDNYQKRTCLWGNFRVPVPQRLSAKGLKKFSMLKSREIYPKLYGVYDRQTRRAITPPGFARAFFEANR